MNHIERLGQVSLAVSDVAAMTDFYRGALGLSFLFAAGPNRSFLDLGGVRLIISRPENGEAPKGNSIFYFKVASVPAVFNEYKNRLNFVDEPHLIAKMPDHELWMVFFKDPEGNLMGFMRNAPNPAHFPPRSCSVTANC